MPTHIDMQVLGAEKVQLKLRQVKEDMDGMPMIRGVRDASLAVMRSGRQNAPVDRGALRASITAEVTSFYGTGKVVGVVGSNKEYALAHEKGTKPYWPEITEGLKLWAKRHGTTAWIVARAIARRGHIALRYLRRALRDNEDRILRILESTVKRIVER